MKALILIAVLAQALPLSAADDPKYTAMDVFTRLSKALDEQAAYQAEVEKAEGPVDKAPTSITKGRLRTQPGARARMDIKAPAPGKVVCDGKSLWIELAEVKQVMKYDATRLIASGNFFLDLASSVRHYSHAAYKRLIPVGEGFDPEKVTALELLPKAPEAAGFERMRVWVDHERWTVLRVLLDFGGTRSDVSFSQIKIAGKDAVKKDPKLAHGAGVFRYKPPKGYEVFDLDM